MPDHKPASASSNNQRPNAHLIVRRGGNFSMQMWWADCSCGWKTVQRDPCWRDQQVMDHLSLNGGSPPKPAEATARNTPYESRLPSGEWRCIRDHRTEPCGDCDGCREVQGLNALATNAPYRQVED